MKTKTYFSTKAKKVINEAVSETNKWFEEMDKKMAENKRADEQIENRINTFYEN